MSSHAAAAVAQPVHEIQIIASQYAFDPATIPVTAGESVRLVLRSKDVVHGFSIPSLKIDAQIPSGGQPITIEFTGLRLANTTSRAQSSAATVTAR